MNHNKYFNVLYILAGIWIVLFLLLLWFKSYRLEQMLVIVIAVAIVWLIYWTYKALTYKYSKQTLNLNKSGDGLSETKDTSVSE